MYSPELIAYQPDQAKANRPPITPEDLQYWGVELNSQLPDKVVIASSSLRKAILLFWQINNFNFKMQPPFLANPLPDDLIQAGLAGKYLDFQTKIEEYIRNGDGVLKQPISLGYLHGVELIVHPTNGESHHNDDPTGESKNKIADIRSHFGPRTWIFASDTVGTITNSGQDLGSHGKPRNSRESIGQFLNGFPLDHWQELLAANQTDKATALLAEFAQAYKEHFYRARQDGGKVTIAHGNALVIDRGVRAGVVYPPESVVVTTTVEVSQQPEFLDALNIYLESGDGGVFQQIVMQNPQIIDAILDNLSLETISALPTREQQSWAILFHIMGVPGWQLPYLWGVVATPNEGKSVDGSTVTISKRDLGGFEPSHNVD